jgi:hypothetical protein
LARPDLPNTILYHNNEYDKLSSKQKQLLEKYLKLKNKYDKRYPPNKTKDYRAI